MEVECAGKLLGKRGMHKKVIQKYNIWLGEIKCNVKCLSQALLMLPMVISSVWGLSGSKFSFPVLLRCVAILLFCYDVLSFSFIRFYRCVILA